MEKVAMLIPYFGTWPEWFDLFLFSCGRNMMVDYLFYTDCPVPKKHPKNIIFRATSFADYCRLVSDKLSVEFRPRRAYKLCDLKVFYGIIHAEDIKNYEFWAYGDVDIIWGNLGIILTPKHLKHFDLLTTHSYHIGGHFTVIRRKSRFTELCLSLPGWQSMLTDQKNYGIDEGVWSNKAYPQLRWLRILYSKIFKPVFRVHLFKYLALTNHLFCNRWTKRSFIEYYTTPTHEDTHQLTETYVYNPNDGRTFAPDGRELPYLHLFGWKHSDYDKAGYKYWEGGRFYHLPADWQAREGYNVLINIDGIREERVS